MYIQVRLFSLVGVGEKNSIVLEIVKSFKNDPSRRRIIFYEYPKSRSNTGKYVKGHK